MVDLNGHEAGNGGHSQGKPTGYRTPLLGEMEMGIYQQLRIIWAKGANIIRICAWPRDSRSIMRYRVSYRALN